MDLKVPPFRPERPARINSRPENPNKVGEKIIIQSGKKPDGGISRAKIAFLLIPAYLRNQG